MARILEFTPRKAQPTAERPTTGVERYDSNMTFEDALEKDIDTMGKAMGLGREEAIDMATAFYRRYPMLMEHVRSTDHLLSHKVGESSVF